MLAMHAIFPSYSCPSLSAVTSAFAELQAMNGRPMYMADWIAKLDDFLR